MVASSSRGGLRGRSVQGGGARGGGAQGGGTPRGAARGEGGNPKSESTQGSGGQGNGGQGQRVTPLNHNGHVNHVNHANRGSQGPGHHSGGGYGRGMFSEKDKETIVNANRPKTIQVAGDCTDDIIIAASGSEQIQHVASFVIRKNGFTGFDGQRQIRHFVNSCLVNLSNHHSVDTSGLLRDLSSSPGLDRLTEIMLKPMSIDAGDIRNLLSFQFVVVPLIGVLTRESVCQTTMTSESGLIYATVYLHWRQFLEQGVMRCIDQLLDRGSLTDHNPTAHALVRSPSICHVSSLQCAMLGIVRLVYQLVKRQQDARVTLAPVVENLYQQTLRCISQATSSADIKFMNDLLTRDVDRLRRIVGDVQDTFHEPINPSKLSDWELGTSKSSKISKGPNMAHLAMVYDPPGDFSEDGPRHNNDHAEISRIDVLPTREEITCPRLPFLPSNNIMDAPHFLPPGWRRQLDIHFRLYREDLLDSLRRGIMAFLDVLNKTDKGNENNLLKQNELRKHLDNNVNLSVYGNVKFLGMKCTKNQGGTIQISFAQPSQAMNASKSKRIEFWERSHRRLKQGSLICMTSRAGTSHADTTFGNPNFHMILGTIVWRRAETLAATDTEAHIHISLTDPTLYLLMLNAATNMDGSGRQWFLVECTGGFFESYRPILRALQNCVPATLPFGRYLAPSAEELAEIQKVGSTIDPPLYSRAPGFTFDLSILLNGHEFRLDITSKDSATQAVDVLQRHSTLDDTQASSLVDTLCREVALISGPPGTGKTKIGVDLMRVLLHNSPAMNCGPIICICYTNHALDQFLEHLLDEKITGIVRVGSRSKSKRLHNHNLESLMSVRGKPYSVRQALRDVQAEWEKISKEINRLEKALRADILAWEYVGPILMMNNPNQWEQLEEAGDETKLEEAGDDFAKVQENAGQSAFVRWATCKDIAEMELWNKAQIDKREGETKEKAPTSNVYAPLVEKMMMPKEEQPFLHAIPNRDRALEVLDGDLWSMSKEERRRLLESWKPEAQESMMELMGSLLKRMEMIGKKKDDAYDDVRRGILRDAKVIGLTTNGAAKSQTLIEAVAPKIIICEEAGEVLESHILATLSASTQHLILIGDHKQLRPSIETHDLSSDSNIGQHHNLDLSLFERLVTAKNPLPSSELTTQRRMRPEISNLIRNTLYENLKDGENVHQYPPVRGMCKNLFFMDHAHPEDMKDPYGMQSFSNTFEVNMVEALAHYLIKNGYDKPGDIAILTPYLGQLSKLRDCLRNSFAVVIDERDQEQLDRNDIDNEEKNESMDNKVAGSAPRVGFKNVTLQKCITLRTIDNYQGEEAKIVIITLVRSNVRQKGSTSSNTIGFLRSPNRTNVLLSRAQHGMFIIGNANLMNNPKNGIWPTVIDELRRGGRIGKGFPIYCKNHPETENIVMTPEVLKRASPNGGCAQACGISMACGHVCPLTCHLNDPGHVAVKCYQPCSRLHRPCQHACPKTCGEKCGDCMEIVSLMTLKCGHFLKEPHCWQKRNPSKVICRAMVFKKQLSCEHEHLVECCVDPSKLPCQAKCGFVRPCGHPCERRCFECQNSSSSSMKTSTVTKTHVPRTNHGICATKCGQTQFCGHTCAAKCHQGSPCPTCKVKCAITCSHSKCHRACNDPCAACCERCVWECPHEGRCNMPCGAPCDRLPCNKRCEKKLSCGHQCPSVCGEVCPTRIFCVECKDPKVMGIVVDMIAQATLAEVDVDKDPIMVLSCGHAATMSTLDGMMEMNTYYQVKIDKKTGDVTFVGKKDFPGKEVSQKSCHLCRQPIVGLLRYGRRIKYGQLSMRMKKYKIVQARSMKNAQHEFDANRTLVQEGQTQFLKAISKTVAGPCSLPLDEESRRLGKYIDQTQPFPNSDYHKIAAVYSIPVEHEEAWIKLLEPLDRSLKKITIIYKSAVQSPTKQLFDAAVSHLYRLKTAPNIHLSERKDGSVYDVQSPLKSTMADDVIRTCILECGLPPDGHGESSYVDSLQERVNVLRLVLAQASIVLDKVGVNTGWYWFVKDLIQCCLVHADIHLRAAIKGSYMRQATYSRLNKMDLLLKHLQWIGLSPMPKDDVVKFVRQEQAGGIMTMFFEEFDQIEKSCPESISLDCAQRLVILREKMDDAVMVADGKDRYRPVSHAEKFEVFRVMNQQLGGSGHWYQCPNGHTYVIADCGMAMTESTCPECGERIGGGHHALLRSNRQDREYEEMYRRRQ